MADMRRFKVTNTTIKPPKYNAQGNDMRPIRDRVGHPVQFVVDRNDKESIVTIQAGRSAVVDDINEGILKLFRKGLVKVDTIKDIADELKSFTTQREKETKGEDETSSQEVIVDTLESSVPEPAKMLDGVKAKAVPMGESHDGDKLVNPDGEPNFVSKANKSVKRTKTSTWEQKD